MTDFVQIVTIPLAPASAQPDAWPADAPALPDTDTVTPCYLGDWKKLGESLILRPIGAQGHALTEH